MIKNKIVPSEPKWGILKYPSAKILSEMTKSLDFKIWIKKGKNREKWSKFRIWQQYMYIPM